MRDASMTTMRLVIDECRTSVRIVPLDDVGSSQAGVAARLVEVDVVIVSIVGIVAVVGLATFALVFCFIAAFRVAILVWLLLSQLVACVHRKLRVVAHWVQEAERARQQVWPVALGNVDDSVPRVASDVSAHVPFLF